MEIHQIDTPELVIRRYRMADEAARFALDCETSDPATPPQTTHTWLHWTITGYDQFARLYQPPMGEYAIALPDSDEAIGTIGLLTTFVPWGVFDNPDHQRVQAEFGLYWAIRPAYQERGYATLATQAFVAQLFQQFNLKRLVATTHHDNLASQRVMEKAGFTLHRNLHPQPEWFQVLGVRTAERS